MPGEVTVRDASGGPGAHPPSGHQRGGRAGHRRRGRDRGVAGGDEGLGADLRGVPGRAPPGDRAACDPLLYRLHDINPVYGTAIKALITEELGDGTTSTIDVRMSVERRADPAGDRVVLTDGREALPYRLF